MYVLFSDSICRLLAGWRMSAQTMVRLNAAFLIGLLLGCASNLIQPTLTDVQWALSHGYDTTLQEPQQGRALYVRKCAGCHNLHRPEDYSPEDWAKLIDEMTEDEDVELGSGDRRLILQYLTAASARANNTVAQAP